MTHALRSVTRGISSRVLRGVFRRLALLIFFAGLAAAPAPAQHTKKQTPQDQNISVPLPGAAQINDEISEMLGYWQLGDAEHMRQYYADDVTFVSGLYEPPLHGWENYAAAYKNQFSQLTSARLDRENTYIKMEGNIAWAAYQWDFHAMMNGQAAAARGQTTLILERRGDRWVIVHNHTSEICPDETQAQTPARPEAPSATPKP